MSDTEAAGRPGGIRDDRARGLLLAEEDGRVVGQEIVYFTLAAPEPALDKAEDDPSTW
ncbi:hypothetical protein AB0I84_48660 [Streptomyces spectabilis]|uniref:hypothetical protein n=1 Tax=Streptomyces spectabilis TaxID=68270 RepID=UPI0033D2FBE7